MWGPQGSREWVAHDPSKKAAKLKGVAVYAAASQGNVGPVDHLPPDFPTPVGGQLVEGITLDCTQQFADAAKAAGVPISFVVRPGRCPYVGTVRLGEVSVGVGYGLPREIRARSMAAAAAERAADRASSSLPYVSPEALARETVGPSPTFARTAFTSPVR